MRQEKQPLYIDITKRFLIFGIFDKMNEMTTGVQEGRDGV